MEKTSLFMGILVHLKEGAENRITEVNASEGWTLSLAVYKADKKVYYNNVMNVKTKCEM